MQKANKILIIVIGIIAIAVAGAYVTIHAVSGLDSPFSVIMSSSMQHDNYQSQIGLIDTADVMIIQDPSRTEIQSYVEATNTGYKTFGDYGSVIIYYRGDDVNPCIHRAIIWLDYNGNGTWSAPSLQNYAGSWSCTESTDIRSLSGILKFYDITQSKKDVSIDLNKLDKQSGYLTMGDNPVTNLYFDQSAGIVSYPIGNDYIKAVAIGEIPWLGVIKVLFNDDKRVYLDRDINSTISLVMIFLIIFSAVYVCDVFILNKDLKKKKRDMAILERYDTSGKKE